MNMPHDDFDLFVLSLDGLVDSAIPIAAARAGAVGLLNLEHARDADVAVREAGRLARLARGRYGVLLGCCPSISEAALSALPECNTLLLTSRPEHNLVDFLDRYRSKVRRVGLVVSSESEALLGVRCGVDLLIAKGEEAGGVVGHETTFVLLQRLRSRVDLPVFAWGGVGWHTAAACRVAECQGVVLDWQLALVRESAVPTTLRQRLSAMDGSGTVTVRQPRGRHFRMLAPLGPPRDPLQGLLEKLQEEGAADPDAWDRTLAALMDDPDPQMRVWAVGQDAAFAADWAAQAPTVARALALLRSRTEAAVEACVDAAALRAGGLLAQANATAFPVLQGPMTRVSDVPEFCEAVANGGGLPFLALALLRREQVRDLLERTRVRMGALPWGVGLLGFVDRGLRAEQLAVIEDVRPPFAIIAGGRPDQAAPLEAKGVRTYLHVPSPAMLEAFLRDGARRFIFEGRECGGHVGPRTSFVLWEQMIGVLLRSELSEAELAKVHVVFAGGIHDALGGAMVSALAQPLVERGIKVGVLLGTAYLFTEEIVRTGAILPTYQDLALEVDTTALVVTGPGHVIRCADTPFVEHAAQVRRHLREQGQTPEQIREELERLNVGRLRIASKGITRAEEGTEQGRFVVLDESAQRREGMYMLGQVAALRRERCTIRELHEQVCNGAVEYLRSLGPKTLIPAQAAEPTPPALDIAIIGMSCLLPGANNLEEFWATILAKRDVISEVPAHRFDSRSWFDADRRARDKTYSKWGGFLSDIPFDPLKYGIPPSSLPSIEPGQMLVLELVSQVLQDAGYAADNPYKDRTCVMLGASGGLADLGSKYIVRALLPQFVTNPDESLWQQLPEWTEDSFPGVLPNVLAGRICNRFDLGGANFTVDAACASSLAALYLACRELADGASDMAVVGGCDLEQNPFSYLAFAKCGALSPRGRSRPFDVSADGIAISEGLAAVVLKRREDAERDGDRIYAVLRAVAAGSDGRHKGLTAPREEGQVRTLQRAYAQAGFSPATISLFEAHGTGTAVGDIAECQSLAALLRQHGAGRHGHAIGSVKSMIGHTKSTAGVAGLVKAALALYHKVLPPTLHVDEPNPKAGLLDGPLYVNTDLRPWVRGEHPRRAGVSSFGFGGTNFHAVLEEYEDDPVAHRPALQRQWPAELFGFAARSPADLAGRVGDFAAELRRAMAAGAELDLANLAFTLYHRQGKSPSGQHAAVVATSVAELLQQLDGLRAALPCTPVGKLPSGVYYTEAPLGVGTPLAFLFPGQGAQYPGMLRELSTRFPEVAEVLEQADAWLASCYDRRLSQFILPPPAFTEQDRTTAMEALQATQVAQPALGACGLALRGLLASFGIAPELLGGHSYGELVALSVAGCFDKNTLFQISHARGTAMAAAMAKRGAMLAVAADRESVMRCLAGCNDVWVANHNAPRQVVLSGSQDAIARAAQACSNAGLAATPLAVSGAFHSPLMAPARAQFEQALDAIALQPPRLGVFCNVTAAVHDMDSAQVRARLSEQLVHEVRFLEQVEAMYQAGTRVFVELGPSNVLTRLVDQILGERPHAAIALQARDRPSLTQLLHALAGLIAQGLKVEGERLYHGRGLRELDLTAPQLLRKPALASHIWLVDGGSARPASQPKEIPLPQAYLAPQAAPPPTPIANTSLTQSSERVNGHYERSAVSTQARHETPPMTEKTTLSNGTAPAPAPMDSVVERSATDADAYAQFQETMRQFLRMQETVLETYFGGKVQATPQPKTATPAPDLRSPPSTKIAEVVEFDEARADTGGSVGSLAEPCDSTVAPADNLEGLLLKLVSERTGYPVESLALEANLEADLGIDSIKRVEIIGAFSRAALADVVLPPSFMEEMAPARTLRAILDGVVRLAARVSPGSENPRTAASDLQAPVAIPLDKVPRCIASVVEAPLPAKPTGIFPEGVVILVGSECPLLVELDRFLTGKGIQVAMLGTHDFASAGAAAQAAGRIRHSQGAVAGVIDLTALKDAPSFPGLTAQDWAGAAAQELKGLLYLLQATAPEAARPAPNPFFFLCVSRGGGDFDPDAEGEALHPWRGGLAGMLKTAAQEWPAARFRSIDVDELPAPMQLLREAAVQGPIEIGYRNGCRLTISAVRADLPDSAGLAEAQRLGPADVVLITGGAQGITAEIAQELAERTQATLALVGRSPAPMSDEDPQTARLVEPAELRRFFFERARTGGRPAAHREVEAQIEAVLKARQIRHNLAAMRQAGSHVEYFSCDVRDPLALEKVVRDIQSRLGAIRALVHGAGIIEDKLIPDKTDDSFERVIATKVLPLLTLERLLDPAQLRLAVFFGSVAGFFGNAGQVDYAAANETMSRMARRLKTRWRGKIVVLNWGPWSGTGMVTPDLARQLAGRGMSLIPVAAGRGAFWGEVMQHNTEELRVIIGGGAWIDEADALHKAALATHHANGNGFALASNGHAHVAQNGNPVDATATRRVR
jgi:acyl transferase domain-containing protein/NAD(P)H-dependent flavin oxidoreductase YrpB (nitropropane dioxygenase family)